MRWSKFTFVEGFNEQMSRRERKMHKSTVTAHAAYSRQLHRETQERVKLGHSKQSLYRPAVFVNNIQVVPQGTASEPQQRTVAPARVDADEQTKSEAKLCPHTGFGHARTELLNVSPDLLDRDTLGAFEFYLSAIGPEYDCISDVFNITNCDGPLLDHIHHRNFFHAFVALGSFLAEQMRQPGAEPSRQVLRHRGLALRLLIKGVQSPKDEFTIWTIVFLAILENAMGNTDVHELHVRNLQAVIIRQSMQLSDMTRVMLRTYTSVWNMETGNSLPSPRMPGEQPIDLWKLPVGFRLLASDLSDDTLIVLSRAVNLGFSSRSTMQQKRLASRRRDIRPYEDLCQACPVLKSPIHSVDKAICLALVVLAHSAFGSGLTTPTFTASRKELTRLLLSADIEDSDAKGWCCLLAIDSWRIKGTQLSPEGNQLLAHLLEHCPRMVGQWSEVQEVVDKFFWSLELNRYWSQYWSSFVRSSSQGLI